MVHGSTIKLQHKTCIVTQALDVMPGKRGNDACQCRRKNKNLTGICTVRDTEPQLAR